MNEFEKIRQHNVKHTSKGVLYLILVVLLLTGSGLVTFMIYDFTSGAKVETIGRDYVIQNVGKKYQKNTEYWTLEVGKDIPEGNYAVHANTVHDDGDNYVTDCNIRINFNDTYGQPTSKLIMQYLTSKNKYLKYPYQFSIGLLDEEEISNIYLEEGTEVHLFCGEPKDVTFTSLDVPEKIDLKDPTKKGMYELNQGEIEIPLIKNELSGELELNNGLEVYTMSDDKEVIYSCMNIDDTCDITTVDLQNGREENKKVSFEDIVPEGDKMYKLRLLDKTYIIVG